MQEAVKRECLFQRMHIFTLDIFDLSLVLKKHSTTYTTVEFCTMQNRYL